MRYNERDGYIPLKGGFIMSITLVKEGKNEGKYRVRVQPVDPITGERYSLPVQYASSQKEAEKIEQRLWGKSADGNDRVTAGKQFIKLFDEYVEEGYRGGKWSVGTYKAWKYSSDIFHEYFPKAKMKDMSQQRIREFARKFVTDRNLSVNANSVVVRRLTHMRSFLGQYVGSVYRINPVPERALNQFFRIDEMTEERQRYVLSDSEINALVTEIELGLNFREPYRCISRLAIYVDLLTGMRPQEVQALTWDSLIEQNGEYLFRLSDSWNEHEYKLNGHLKARKRGATRITLPISPKLKGYLDEFKVSQEKYLRERGITNRQNFIFLNLNDYKKCSMGYPVTQTSLNQMLRHLGNKIGLSIGNRTWTMYSLRHTVATKLGGTPGMSYPWAAERMGHTLAEFTRTYVHSDRDMDTRMTKLWLNSSAQE